LQRTICKAHKAIDIFEPNGVTVSTNSHGVSL
jgi:hypothetical protein